MRACLDLDGGYVVDVPSLGEFEKCLETGSFGFDQKAKMPLNHCERMEFAPSQWCTNAATFTALDQENKVWTATTRVSERA
jgi:hypothetical protein